MTHSLLMLSDDNASAIFANVGLWAFLAIGAVSLFGIFLPVSTWLESRRKDREAFYKAETLRRITDSSSDGARASVEYMRESSRLAHLQKVEALKIGGVILTAVGLGVFVMLWTIAGREVSTCGLIPLFIGVAMLVYVFFLAAPVEPPAR